MAASFATRAPGEGVNPWKVPGAYFDAIVEVTGDASYPAGGYPFTTTQLNTLTGGAFSMIESVDVVNPWDNVTTSFMAVWIKSTNKIAARAQAVAGGATAQVDVTATTPLTGFVCSLRVRAH
jgi:hypothetical protein